MKDRTDEEIMTAYAAGDARAASALFERYAVKLHAFFARSFRDAAVADDLLQTTFLRVHGARSTYRTGARVRPWLFAIAARLRIDELRRRYRLPPTAGDDAVDTLEAPPEASLEARDEAQDRDARVRAAIDALPQSQRVVVQLHRFEELSFAEIAETLGIQEGAARVRAFRAYERLRETLAPLVAGTAQEEGG